MTSEELVAVLDERIAPLTTQVEELSKSVVTPAPSGEGAPATVVETPAAPASATDQPAAEAPPSIEDITKAIMTALEPYNDILEKVFDRLENVERAHALGTRKSLTGQEGGEAPEAPPTPTIADAITKALRNPSSVRVVEAPKE